MIPLSLYIHIPWCIRKCPYCDFNSHAIQEKKKFDEAVYVQHLLNDLRASLNLFIPERNRILHSIFIGGGTPSLFSGQAIAHLISGIRQEIDFEKDLEITLEANPATWEQEKFAAYLDAGVNRLSLGVQSFQPAQLQNLGRVHRRKEALQAIETAQKVGFQRINVDLMFALPQQSVAEALQDLQQAIAFQPEHISWYQLTIEPNTAFYKQPPILPELDTQYEIYEAGSAFLRQHHYQQYETSAWTKGQMCRHNLNYWEFGDYLGIGAGAHGKITRQQNIQRYQQFASPVQYQKAMGKHLNPYMARLWQVSPEEQSFEFMMNALRLKNGVHQELFAERCFVEWEKIAPIIHDLEQKGLLEKNSKRFQTSALGFAHLNQVLAAFL